MILSTLKGVHTFSSGMVLTYDQFRKIFDACYKTGYAKYTSDVWSGEEKLYCYAYHKHGIKVFLYGKLWKLYRLRVQVEPCRVLGEPDPTALAKLGKRQYKDMVKAVDAILKTLKIPCSIDEMKISRCDLTVNVEFSSQDELMEYLRIFQNSLHIRRYERVTFKKNMRKVKDSKKANDHSYCISCRSARFLIYDKIAQLEMIDRYDETMAGRHVLRLEAELKRPALKAHLGKSAMETNYKLLSSAVQKSEQIIRWYLSQMQPLCERYLRYEDAVRMVETSGFKERTRASMLYLLRKTSDSKSLTAALNKLLEKYDLSKSQCRTILNKFKELGISPITLTNNSGYDELPPIFK